MNTMVCGINAPVVLVANQVRMIPADEAHKT